MHESSHYRIIGFIETKIRLEPVEIIFKGSLREVEACGSARFGATELNVRTAIARTEYQRTIGCLSAFRTRDTSWAV